MADAGPPPFTPEEVQFLKNLLAENSPIPPHIPGSMGRREHVTYCFSQMIRFPHLANAKKEAFRSAQFGLSLGRVQELLLGVGGKAAWWSRYEPLLLVDDFEGLMAVTRSYMAVLGLPEPDEAFLNKQ